MPDEQWQPPTYAQPTKQPDWQPPDYAKVVPADETPSWGSEFLAGLNPWSKEQENPSKVTVGDIQKNIKEKGILGGGYQSVKDIGKILTSPRSLGEAAQMGLLFHLPFGGKKEGEEKLLDPKELGEELESPESSMSDLGKDIELKPEPKIQPTKLLGPAKTNLESVTGIPTGEIKQNKFEMPPSVADDTGGYNPVESKPAELPSATRTPTELHEVTNQLFPEGNAPSLETAKSIEIPPEDEVIPPPGSARTKDISAFAANSGSADQILESREATKPIVKLVRDEGWDKSQEEIGNNIRTLDDITEGLNKDQLESFGKLAEGVGDEEDKASIPDVENKLKDYRELMDEIFDKAKVARGGDLGYIKDYFTHIEKMPEDDIKSGLQDIFNYRQGKDALKALFESPELPEEGTGESQGIYGKGMGEVSESPFTKKRADKLENLDYNVNKLGRIYIDSMARETHLRPAVSKAEEIVKSLPDSKLKELSEWYIKNVTRFDASPNLNRAYKKVVRTIVNTTSRSMLGFNPHLQELHAMRLGPVYAELGNKYSLKGIANILKNPRAAYDETARLGLLPSELYPFRFQTTGERVDSILNFKSMVDFIDRSIAYNGFKSKYEDMGMNPKEAMQKAITDTKKTTFMVDPSRANKMLNPEYSNVVGRLAAQYKQVPAKIIEWIAQTGLQYKNNPAAAARMIALLGTTQALKAAGGPNIFHMPTSLMDWSAASMNELRKITTYAIKGDFDKAAEEVALWITPAGKSLERLFSK